MDDRQESRITNVNLGETMRKSFLEYAMSVIVARHCLTYVMASNRFSAGFCMA